jgi:hypothetical protein
MGFSKAEMKLELFSHLIKEHKYSFDLDISFEDILKKLLRLASISLFCEKLVKFWIVFWGKGCASGEKLGFSCLLELKADDIIFLFKFKNNINSMKLI